MKGGEVPFKLIASGRAMADGSTCVQDERDHSSASATCYGVLPLAEVHRYSGTADLEAARRGRLARGRLLATCDAQGRYLSLGGPLEGAVPGQPWTASTHGGMKAQRLYRI